MANETAEEQQQSQSQTVNNNEDEKQTSTLVKGYRKKGLVSEKVLLERLSDMSIEDNLINPVITLSSVEDEEDIAMEDEDEEEEETRRKNFARRSPLKTSLSLDVPTLNLKQEAKRPPL